MILKKLANIKISPINFILLAIFFVLFIFSIINEVSADTVVFSQSDGTSDLTFASYWGSNAIQFSENISNTQDILVENFTIECTNGTWKSFLNNPGRFEIQTAPNSGTVRSTQDNVDPSNGLSIDGNVSQTFSFIIEGNGVGGAITTGTNYYLYWLGNGNGNCWVEGDSGGIPKITMSLVSDPVTRIIEVLPATNQVVSTSTFATTSVTGFIGSEVELPIKVSYVIQNNNSWWNLFLGNEYSTSTVITSYGQFTWQSTLDYNLTEGSYSSSVKYENSCIDIPFVGLSCFGILTNDLGQLYSTTTYWTAGTSTAFGADVNNAFNSLDQALNITASGTTTPFFDSCAPFSGQFNAGQCIAGLFIPDRAQISSLITNARNLVLTKAPWGYGTRVYDIFFASSTPENLPSTSIDIPTGLPMAGATIDFNIFTETPIAIQKIASTTVETIDGSPWEKFLFYWNLMWYIVFGFYILKRIYGVFDVELGFLGGDASGRIRKDVRGNYYQEWSTADIKRKLKRGDHNKSTML